MTQSEWNDLVRSLTRVTAEPIQGTPNLMDVELAAPSMGAVPAPRIEELVSMLTAHDRPVPTSVPNVSTKDSDTGSTAGTVLKTVGMATGLGPLVTGLFKLFGGGDKVEPEFAASTYIAPEALDVAAGLSADRTVSGVTYGQGDVVRSNPSSATATPIQINVQAFDSRSFVDHSDEIARAVREAMLHSHSLNDVVAEL